MSQSTPIRSPSSLKSPGKSENLNDFRRELEIIKNLVNKEKKEMFCLKDSLKTIEDKLNESVSGLNNTTVRVLENSSIASVPVLRQSRNIIELGILLNFFSTSTPGTRLGLYQPIGWGFYYC